MNIETGHLIFIDIETVPGNQRFDEMPLAWQELWIKKMMKSLPEEATIEGHYLDKAALFAEFGKIVCISFGYYNATGPQKTLRIKSLCGQDEKELLTEFCELMTQFEKHHKGWVFAGHNIREFDIPYLSRRMLINGLGIPSCLSFYKKKPWDYDVVDTLHIWRFGDFRSYISLELLATSLNVPSPKSDITGSQVAEVFWQKDFRRIAEYCQRDVLAVANIVQRLNGDELLTDEQIEIVQ